MTQHNEVNQPPTNRRLLFDGFSPSPQNSNNSNNFGDGIIRPENPDLIPPRSETASPSFRRINFDYESEKENIPPENFLFTRYHLNPLFNPSRHNTCNFIDLKLKSHQSEDPNMYEETPNNQYGFFYSQGQPLRTPQAQNNQNLFNFGHFKNTLSIQRSESMSMANNFSNEREFFSQPTNLIQFEANTCTDILDFTRAESNYVQPNKLNNSNSWSLLDKILVKIKSDLSEDSTTETSEATNTTINDCQDIILILPVIKNLKYPELNTISCETVRIKINFLNSEAYRSPSQ